MPHDQASPEDPATGTDAARLRLPQGDPARKRLVLSVGIAAGTVLAATMMVPTQATGVQGVDGHDHDHSDPATKNALSRSATDSDDPLTQDPTTAEEVAANTAAVAARRSSDEPALLPGPAPAERREAPEDRYAMAGGCYALQSDRTGQWLVRDGDGYLASAAQRESPEPFHFQATDLGQYLLFDSDEGFVAKAATDPVGLVGSAQVTAADEPSRDADWTVTKSGPSYVFGLPHAKQGLALADNGRLVLSQTPHPFTLRLTDECAAWPEVETNVSGQPHVGETGFAEVRGYADAHTHHMAYEFLGGEVHCGRPWHRYGVEHALVDCDDHTMTGGNGAVLETFLSGRPSHDPVGWPTFRDWPAPDSLTHEGTYHKWLERSWRGGLRLFVNLLVENNKLCEVYPLKRNSCDDMDSIRLQAQRMREFERYVDAQSGGPGEGWYRIVTDPFEAREVINDGKLAVVMGIETSVLFGCTMKADVPQCDEESITRQMDEVHDLGVRQMELVNKFDNALSGVAGDAGTTGVVVNSANFLETGSFWKMRTCPESFGEGVHDREQYAVPRDVSDRDPLFGAIAENYLPDTPVAVPVYPSAPHCNQRALTDLGAFTIQEIAERNMLFDPDHMSVLARRDALDLVEGMEYPGVLSSHSWSTPDAYPRISEMGGFIAPYAGDSTGFVEKWRYHVGRADPRYLFGLGFGADINGLGAQGDPRGADAENPVTYPFTGLGGVVVDRQVSGERVYDINVDGVAHHGLYPDWVEDLRRLAGEEIVQDMARAAEAYLQTWERALGIEGDACTGASEPRSVTDFRSLPRGASTEEVLRAVGQPHSRMGDTFTYCAQGDTGAERTVRLVFDDTGRLLR